MARVEIVESLYEEIERKFKGRASEVFDLMESLEQSPHKGKSLGHVGDIVIKELKFEGFRFYFLADGHTLKFADEHALQDLLLRFVRMSDKKEQQQAINEIKHILKAVGSSGFT